MFPRKFEVGCHLWL